MTRQIVRKVSGINLGRRSFCGQRKSTGEPAAFSHVPAADPLHGCRQPDGPHHLHGMRYPPVAPPRPTLRPPPHIKLTILTPLTRWSPCVTSYPRSHASADQVARKNLECGGAKVCDIWALVRCLSVTWTAARCSAPSASTSAGGAIEVSDPRVSGSEQSPAWKRSEGRGEGMAHRPAWASRLPLFPPVKLFSRAPIPPPTHPSQHPPSFPSLSPSRNRKLLWFQTQPPGSGEREKARSGEGAGELREIETLARV